MQTEPEGGVAVRTVTYPEEKPPDIMTGLNDEPELIVSDSKPVSGQYTTLEGKTS